MAHREKYNFTGDMIETYIFSFMTEDFGGLNLSSNVVGPLKLLGLFPGAVCNPWSPRSFHPQWEMPGRCWGG